MNKITSFFTLFFVAFSFAQTDSLEVNEIDSLIVEQHFISLDSIHSSFKNSGIYNAETLDIFFQKLQDLETNQNRKVNIVHIGDSHIQADLMTDMLRQKFQERFGNSGLGLVFPHSLAKTNGSSHVRFSSNGNWNSLRNIYPNDGSPVGLSGIALFTTQNNFVIELNVRNENYHFNNLKIITPENKQLFGLANATKTIVIKSNVPKTVTHKIKSGETLSGIANRYKTTVANIRQANGLKNNNIRAGASLKIPTGETEPQKIEMTDFIPLENEPLISDYYYEYQHLETTDKVYLISNKEHNSFALNGIVLENNQSGILYHSIGVNGAKYSDYNKYPLFFEQLGALHPDLIIVSLGTNEAFDKLCDQCFYSQLEEFLSALRTKNPNVAVLLTTPPPSLFKRRTPNNFVESYTNQIISNSLINRYSVWDLYRAMGGNESMQKLVNQGLIAKDRVHYSSAGYKEQGFLLFETLMETYQNYLNQ